MSIIEIDKAGLGLSVKAGFLHIKQAEQEVKIALDQVDCVILNSYGAVLSNHVLSRLCELNIPLLVCGSNANPIGILLANTSNVYRKERIEKQLNISVALQRNLWQQIIKAKLINQAKVLSICGKKHLDVKTLAGKVRSGDEGNAEAIGARIYWQRLFGSKFKRNPDLLGINACLNYGYAVLRAAFCRSIVAAGLIPELGVHHRNAMNPFCLADDLMEPYRPFVDRMVFNLTKDSITDLNPTLKRCLIDVLELPVTIRKENHHMKTGINLAVQKLVASHTLKKAGLEYPVIDA